VFSQMSTFVDTQDFRGEPLDRIIDKMSEPWKIGNHYNPLHSLRLRWRVLQALRGFLTPCVSRRHVACSHADVPQKAAGFPECASANSAAAFVTAFWSPPSWSHKGILSMAKLHTWVKNILTRNEEGASAAEYALLLALVTVGVAAAV